jgi:putative endonuclease
MSRKKVLGQWGEDLITKILKQRGYNILARNLRYHRSEFDLIASKNKRLYVVEVKTRASSIFGEPESAVTRKKLDKFSEAYSYLEKKYNYQEIVYLIAAIIVNFKNKQARIKFIKII